MSLLPGPDILPGPDVLPEATGTGPNTAAEGFIVTVKRAVIRALRAGIDDDLPDKDPLKRVKGNIDMEYPASETKYPGIWVQFSYTEVQKTGIDDTLFDEDGRSYQLWQYAGRVSLNIVALSSKERDRISESFVEMFAFGSTDSPRNDFWESFSTNEYVTLSANRDSLKPQGQTVTVGAPWNPDLLVYEDAYAFDIIGQFASRPNSVVPVLLSRIDILPTFVPGVAKAGEWV